MTTELLATPLNPAIWQQYLGFFAAHGARDFVPPMPKAGIWLLAASGALVSGVGIYSTDSTFLFAEGFATNGAAPLRLRHRAAMLSIHLLQGYAAARGQHIVASPRLAGVAKVLRRAGFIVQPGVIMTSRPALRIPV